MAALQQRTIDLIREHQSTLIAQWRDNLNAAGQNDDSRIGARDLDIQVNEFWQLLLPSLSVAWRRMHDVGRGGWWTFVPIANIVFTFVPSVQEVNRWGPPPPPRTI